MSQDFTQIILFKLNSNANTFALMLFIGLLNNCDDWSRFNKHLNKKTTVKNTENYSASSICVVIVHAILCNG